MLNTPQTETDIDMDIRPVFDVMLLKTVYKQPNMPKVNKRLQGLLCKNEKATALRITMFII